MVQAPSRFTLAEHEVRRLRSRSVAVIVSRSSAASNKKLERMGIVVLRSTTPCVAVSSFSSSNLLTLISIAVPCIAPVASAAINPPRQVTDPAFYTASPYIKSKTYKTSSNSRSCGKVEIETVIAMHAVKSPQLLYKTAIPKQSSCDQLGRSFGGRPPSPRHPHRIHRSSRRKLSRKVKNRAEARFISPSSQ